MVRKVFGISVVAVLAAAGLFWAVTEPVVVPASALPVYSPNAAHGKAVFEAADCASCHAVAGEPRTMLGGGQAIPSRVGTLYAPNISPHPSNGIGNWTEAQFVTAVMKGTSPQGSHYYPAFPYVTYQRSSVGDVRDLFAYVKTLPPLSGRARDPEIRFPFNIRRLIGLWKLAYLDGKPV